MRSRKSSSAEQLALEWAVEGGPPRTRGPLPRRRLRRMPALVAGVDEAGRGPLAGPVVAAAVILDELHPIKGLADSKLLTAARRDRLFDEICARALCVSIAEASIEEIDRLNILHATMLAMRRAVAGLRLAPLQVWVDGNRAPELDAPVPVQTIVKGDATVPAISAASILAKVRRDRMCAELHRQYPAYGFDGHKGYATAAHLAALRQHGACPAHRRSFAPVREAGGWGKVVGPDPALALASPLAWGTPAAGDGGGGVALLACGAVGAPAVSGMPGESGGSGIPGVPGVPGAPGPHSIVASDEGRAEQP
jgi:ribonuclease HII